jgi:hypothetical protein
MNRSESTGFISRMYMQRACIKTHLWTLNSQQDAESIQWTRTMVTHMPTSVCELGTNFCFILSIWPAFINLNKNPPRFDEEEDNLYYNYYQHDTREDYQMASNPNQHKPQSYQHAPMNHHQPVSYYAPVTPYVFQPRPQAPRPVLYQPTRVRNETQTETQPQMLSFNHFMSQVKQNLTPEQANKRYNEYKNHFRKEQIQIFFDQHKDEDW